MWKHLRKAWAGVVTRRSQVQIAPLQLAKALVTGLFSFPASKGKLLGNTRLGQVKRMLKVKATGVEEGNYARLTCDRRR